MQLLKKCEAKILLQLFLHLLLKYVILMMEPGTWAGRSFNFIFYCNRYICDFSRYRRHYFLKNKYVDLVEIWPFIIRFTMAMEFTEMARINISRWHDRRSFWAPHALGQWYQQQNQFMSESPSICSALQILRRQGVRCCESYCTCT